MTTSIEIRKLKSKSQKEKRNTLTSENLDNQISSKSKFGLFQALRISKQAKTKKKGNLRKSEAQIGKEEADATVKIKKLLKDTHNKCQNVKVSMIILEDPLYRGKY